MSAVEPPRCRRRLILADEPDETEEVVVLTLIEALPSSGQLTSPTEIVDLERERRERKRKGKAAARPVKKKPRHAASTLVIHEGRQRVDEDENEEEEALRREHCLKNRNDEAKELIEQEPERAGLQFEKLHADLTDDMLVRMITFDDPKLTKEYEARVAGGKKLRAGRRLKEETLKELNANT